MKADWDFLLLCLCAMLSALSLVSGDIAIYSVETREVELEILDMPAVFTPSVPMDGLRGLVMYSTPANACSPVEPPPKAFPNHFKKWILLIQRNFCTYEEKVRNAEAAGFDAVIVHNVNSSDLIEMGGNATGIKIPAVFIGAEDGLTIKESYLFDTGFYVCINRGVPFGIPIQLLLIFSILVGLCFLGMVIFVVYKYFKDRRRQQRHRLPKSSLKNMPVHTFKKNDPYEVCAICLEEYQVGEKLRVLPCLHAYHQKCIDPWLTKSRRVCPVCKRKVVPGRHNASSESESDDETQPLLRASSSTQVSGSNYASTDNVFQRERRRFLSSNHSETSSNASSLPDSSDESGRGSGTGSLASNPHLHSVPVDVEETRSLIEEPSVNA